MEGMAARLVPTAALVVVVHDLVRSGRFFIIREDVQSCKSQAISTNSDLIILFQRMLVTEEQLPGLKSRIT